MKEKIEKRPFREIWINRNGVKFKFSDAGLDRLAEQLKELNDFYSHKKIRKTGDS